MNLRPSGYEPDELPDCSTPLHACRWIAAHPREVNEGETLAACDSDQSDGVL